MAAERRQARKLEHDREGWWGERTWHVEDEVNALVALEDPDIPEIYDSWPDFDSLRVQRQSFAVEEGRHTLVTCHYTTRDPWAIGFDVGYGPEGEDIPVGIRERWDTAVITGFTTVDLDGEIIAQGRGCTVYEPHTVLIVEATTRYEEDLTGPLGFLYKTNDDDFKSEEAGHWLCTGVMPEQLSATRMKVTYTLELNPKLHGWDHTWYFQTMADAGDNQGFMVPDIARGLQNSPIYESVDFDELYTVHE